MLPKPKYADFDMYQRKRGEFIMAERYYYKARAEFAIAALESAEEQLRKQDDTTDHIWFDVKQAVEKLKANK